VDTNFKLISFKEYEKADRDVLWDAYKNPDPNNHYPNFTGPGSTSLGNNIDIGDHFLELVYKEKPVIKGYKIKQKELFQSYSFLWEIEIERGEFNKAGDADIFVSIHLNSAATYNEKTKTWVQNDAPNGFVVLFKPDSDKSKELAGKIADSQSTIPLIGDGKSPRTDLYVLNKFQGDASVLIEVGFITNASDAKTISEKSDEIGKQIATGIINFINANTVIDKTATPSAAETTEKQVDSFIPFIKIEQDNTTVIQTPYVPR